MEQSDSHFSGALFSSIYRLYDCEFSERLSDLEAHSDDSKAKEFFQDVLVFNKDSMLSYTASPKSPLNQRIIALAQRLSLKKKIHPLHVLMPNLSLECIQNPKQDQSGTSVYYHLNDPTVSVETILSQYISGDPGRAYWIPVKILAECSIQEATHKLPNYYCDFALTEEQRGTGYLTDSEVHRLYHFSSQTRQLWDLRQNYDDFLQADLSLLAQLNILLKNMRFNSRDYGHGTEFDAGLGAYLALIHFLEYYQRLRANPSLSIPEEIRNEIDFLSDLTSNPMVNTSATTETQTCMSLRYDTLWPLVQSHKEGLARIYPQEVEGKSQVLLQIEQDYRKIQSDLVTSFKKGHDPLGVSEPLLTLCQNHIQLRSESDLYLFLSSCPERECANFLNPKAAGKALRKSILGILRLNSHRNQLIPNLVILLLELQPQKGKIFLQEFPEIRDKLKRVPMGFSEILMSFEGEKFQALLEGLSPDVLFYYENHSQELKDSNLFTEDKKRKIQSETIKLADKVQDFSSFMQIYSNITERENKRQFIEVVGVDKLASFSKNARIFNEISQSITNKIQKKNFINKMGFSQLADFIIDWDSFRRTYPYLSPKHKKQEFMEKLGFEKLVSFVTNEESFCYILSYYNNFLSKTIKNQKQNFLNKGIEKLAYFVKDAQSFSNTVSKFKGHDNRKLFVEKIGIEKLLTFVIDLDSFYKISSNIPDENQRQQFLDKGIQKLASSITNVESFYNIASKIKNITDRSLFLDKGIKKLASSVTDIYSFKDVFSKMMQESQSQIFIEKVGLKKLAGFILDKDSFMGISSKLKDLGHKKQFVEAVGFEKLSTYVIDTRSFNDIVLHISGDQRQNFIEFLGFEKLAAYVIDIESTYNIAYRIRDVSQKQKFVEKGFEKLANYVTDKESFKAIASQIKNPNQSLKFIEVVGFQTLVSCVADKESFNTIFSHIRDESQSKNFIEALGLKELASYTTDKESFNTIALQIKDSNQSLKFIEAIGFQTLAAYVRDKESFHTIISHIRDRSQRKYFVEAIGFDTLATYVINKESFNTITAHIREKSQNKKFLEAIGFKKLASLVSNVHDFRSFLSNIMGEDHKRDFIEKGIERLASLVTNIKSFKSTVSNIKDNDLKQQFITKGIEKLASLVKNVSLLRSMTSSFNDEEQREQFIEKVLLYSMEDPLKNCESLKIFQEVIGYCREKEDTRKKHAKRNFQSVLETGLRSFLQNHGDPSVFFSSGSEENKKWLVLQLSPENLLKGSRDHSKPNMEEYCKASCSVPGESLYRSDVVESDLILSGSPLVSFSYTSNQMKWNRTAELAIQQHDKERLYKA